MPNDQSTLRFDHREIAVIFSLFVFVSLLMFTVGIVVGKGLSQARYSAPLNSVTENGPPSPAEPVAHGTSVSTPEHPQEPVHAPPSPIEASASVPQHASVPQPEIAPAVPTPPLDLVPQKPGAMTNQRFQEPKEAVSTDDLIKNPKIQALIDDPAAPQRRESASVRKPAPPPVILAPPSFAQGPFTVQVNSYPTQKDAADRVETLKKIGYSHAYFTTVKDIGNSRETWYRVWIGYFPDYDSAQTGGQFLQSQGEVKNYLVRKSDAAG